MALTCGNAVPPAGFEPAHPAPEADALSPELRGLGNPQRLSHGQQVAAQPRSPTNGPTARRRAGSSVDE